MRELEELAKRVSSAKTTLENHDKDFLRQLSVKDQQISQLLAKSTHQQELIDTGHVEIESLVDEKRQLKEMLLSLLDAIESRSKEDMFQTLKNLSTLTEEMIASQPGPLPEPDPLPEPEPEPVLTQPEPDTAVVLSPQAPTAPDELSQQAPTPDQAESEDRSLPFDINSMFEDEDDVIEALQDVDIEDPVEPVEAPEEKSGIRALGMFDPSRLWKNTDSEKSDPPRKAH